jgi:hypothetical protein
MFLFCSGGNGPYMVVTTLGEAFRLGWRVKAHCLLFGPMPKSSHGRTNVCRTTVKLDMQTLVWTRGEAFPLDLLDSRLRCPRCGGRRIQVVFEPPSSQATAAAR